MDAKVRSKVIFSTQDHLEIKDIIDDMVVTKSGSIALAIQTTSVNFDLLSEIEQDNKIYGFAGLLNSLNFHIQILVRTHRIDISNYVNYLKSQLERDIPQGLRHQLEIYIHFIQNLIIQNDVLDKKFYIVIPYHPSGLEEGPSARVASSSSSESSSEKALEQGKIFLYPKRDHILKQLGKMGLMGHQLTNNELIEVFYNTYNPSSR